MVTLYLAGNETLGLGAHLQFVFEQDGQFFEIEVQGSFNPVADWRYVSAKEDGALPDRLHLGQNTNGTSSDGSYDPAIYGRVAIASGEAAGQLWANLQAINNSMAQNAAGMDYDTIGADSQNSNSFVNSLAWAVGINIHPYIAQISSLTEDISTSAYLGSTRNVFESAGNGFGNNYIFPTIVVGTEFEDFSNSGEVMTSYAADLVPTP